jgi:hypothetical protein
MTGALLSGGWFAIQLILNPGRFDSIPWLGKLLPDVDPQARSPKTLDQIQAELDDRGLILGDPLTLETADDTNNTPDLLFPVWQALQSCDGGAACRAMVELRVYRPLATRRPADPVEYDLLDLKPIRGPKEFFVVAPFVYTTSGQGSSRDLPLTTLYPIESRAPENVSAPPGLWFHAAGQWVRGSNRANYGLVIRYNPQVHELQVLDAWASSANTRPYWQAVTGDEWPELVVDRTLGLEPNLTVYQVKALSEEAVTVQLDAIALTTEPLDLPSYDRGMILAQAGLWQLAAAELNTAKAQGEAAGIWSATTQAQLDVIQLHGAIAQQNASQDWASPSQQLTVYLLNGQWRKGLDYLRDQLKEGIDLTLLLQDDNGRFWQRITAALRTNPNQPDVLAWGGVFVAVKRGQPAAIAWLNQQVNPTGTATPTPTPSPTVSASPSASPATPQLVNSPLLSSARQALDWLENFRSTHTDTMATSGNRENQTQFYRMLGTVIPEATISQQDWQPVRSGDPLQLESGESWYRIPVTDLLTSERWMRSPFASQLLQGANATSLGLTSNPQVEIAVWQDSPSAVSANAQITLVTVRAVQQQGDRLTLLASGIPLPLTTDASGISPDAIAMTPGSVDWLTPVEDLSLAAFNQQFPDWGRRILSQIGATLTASQAGNSASIKLLDLTGDQQVEAVVEIPAQNPETGTTFTQTIILDGAGSVLYQDLNEKSLPDLMAITAVDGSPIPALLVNEGDRPHFLYWSAATRRFE